MGIIDKMMGNASEVDTEKLAEQVGAILGDGEEIGSGFAVWRDIFCFTNKRLILIDKQGLTGSKCEYLSIPYRSVEAFSIETAGMFDRDSELKIWVRGRGLLEIQLKKGNDIKGVCRTLSSYVLS